MAATTRTVCVAVLAMAGVECLAERGINRKLDAATEAILQTNVEEHQREHAALCRHYHCGQVERAAAVATETYPLGMKSVDFAHDIAASDALIHVTKQPLFTEQEMNNVIATAEEEGVGLLSE
jgi:hypothetical protein